MEPMSYLAQLDKLFESGKSITPEWQDTVYAGVRMVWENAVKAGTEHPDSLRFYDSESLGKRCPLCNSAPDIIDSPVNYRGRYMGAVTRYRLTCSCESQAEQIRFDQKSLKERIEACQIPQKYLLSDWKEWDTGVHVELTQAHERVKAMSYGHGLQELLKKMGVCLYGDNGRGKTMTGVCLLKAILSNTHLKCRYVSMSDYAAKIFRAGKNASYEEELEQFDVLYLDDVDKISTESKWVQERVFSLFDRMYRDNKTIIMSTNLLTIPEIREFFKEHGNAIVSRMAESMDFARFVEGSDYREKIRKERH